MSALQRRKGIRGENQAYEVLYEKLGPIVQRRNLSQARDGGGDLLIQEARVLVEVKREERRRVPAWLKQAEAAALLMSETAKPPWASAVLWHRNREPWQAFVLELGYRRGDEGWTVDEFCDWVRGRLTTEASHE